jgi:hypothetical protein
MIMTSIIFTRPVCKANRLEGVDDIHYHPVEPRTIRVKAEYRF